MWPEEQGEGCHQPCRGRWPVKEKRESEAPEGSQSLSLGSIQFERSVRWQMAKRPGHASIWAFETRVLRRGMSCPDGHSLAVTLATTLGCFVSQSPRLRSGDEGWTAVKMN